MTTSDAATSGPSHTASTAFLEALKLAGVNIVFTNLGSDHPSFVEAIARGKAEQNEKLPEFVSVTHEMVALSAAQGYYQATGKMAGLLLHVDCGLLNAGGAIHNVFRARVPVVVFSGLSPITQEDELRGSRSEFIHWVQDVHDQAGIVRGYTKYTYEFRTGRNIGQVTMRAAQIAMSEPRGPVYLFGSREVMEEELPSPVPINPSHWQAVEPSALSPSAVNLVKDLLLSAQNPLVVTSWLGNSDKAVAELVRLAERLAIPVVDATPFAVNFPTTHQLYAGSHWTGGGQNALLAEADVVLLLDSDVPWIPTQNQPSADATLIHIDSDPLKAPMPLFYVAAQHRYQVSSAVALEQLNAALPEEFEPKQADAISARNSKAAKRSEERKSRLREAETPQKGLQGPQSAAVALGALRKVLPEDTVVISEAISNYAVALDHLMFTDPRRYFTSGASSLGYHGGAAVGAKLGLQAGKGRTGTNAFVCAVTGDGSYMFSVPSTVQHLASKNNAPFLTVVLSNGGWKSPKLSTLLVHPTGFASCVHADALGVSFGPAATRPDFAALAVAAAGGLTKAWGKRVVCGAEDFEDTLKDAVDVVLKGRSATVEVIIPEL